MACAKLNELLSSSAAKLYKTNFGYKLEPIVNRRGITIGYECLIDFTDENNDQRDEVLKYDINSPFLVSNLLNRLLSSFHSGVDVNVLAGKKLFINIERSCLCFNMLINEIILFNRVIQSFDIILVVEITERELSFCRGCPEIKPALIKLDSSGVLLAADDFDMHRDFRANEVGMGVYHYLKVEYSRSDRFCFDLQALANKYPELSIIVERIETQDDLKRLCNAKVLMQGYAFDTIRSAV
ncbi:hypothetical protein [Vibrio sp. SCSIO 43137]|uniref:hypothetical protein n=1 Tax=Vibrio sp. SCSIO 43137 TaxID=3021011 RepID=UPI00230731ED|nr:hypothetical protein [Vibrio sp. SCSIO 43137]WCE31659.1 hypothetical protein PK654_21265 [Vibrio sp. SCSIO 43137]